MIRTGMRRHARHGKGGGGHGPLALIPMIDMLTILVVYLLVHTADMEILPNSKNISIPQSNSEQKPREATVVMVTRDMLYVNGEPVVTVGDLGATAGQVSEPLRAALDAQAQGLGDRLVAQADAQDRRRRAQDPDELHGDARMLRS